jgi:hypothetical protein
LDVFNYFILRFDCLYNPAYKDTPVFFCVCWNFNDWVFMLNYGQFVPAWDSNYYGMMMSQNIPMKQYLNSKAVLMSVSVLILAILSTLSLFWVENPSHKSSLCNL